MSEHNVVVAIYNTHTEAEAAIKELVRASFTSRSSQSSGKTITLMSTW